MGRQGLYAYLSTYLSCRQRRQQRWRATAELLRADHAKRAFEEEKKYWKNGKQVVTVLPSGKVTDSCGKELCKLPAAKMWAST